MLPALCQKHLISFVKGSFFSISIYSEQVNPTCRRTSVYESETSYTSSVTIIITNLSQNCKPCLQFLRLHFILLSLSPISDSESPSKAYTHPSPPDASAPSSSVLPASFLWQGLPDLRPTSLPCGTAPR